VIVAKAVESAWRARRAQGADLVRRRRARQRRCLASCIARARSAERLYIVEASPQADREAGTRSQFQPCR
jgi:hypothetical protein